MKQITVLFALFFSIALAAQEPKKEAQDPPVFPPKSFVTDHSMTLDGKAIPYQTIAGETYLKDKDGNPVASIWSTAYLVKPSSANEKRSVTFVFNGGPGSASIWLHVGLLGPKLVQVESDAKEDDGAAPFTVINNPYPLLDLTDLVFIDPVGTGYSTAIGKGKEEDYWGLNEDATSVAQFIRQWVTEHKRWNAPKYIIGESFGTTRAAGVAHELMGDGQSMSLNGIVMVSQALDYAGSTSEHDNITSYLTYLPSMAATAWYHKKAGQGKTLEEFVEEARQFTYDVYAPALLKGNFMAEKDKKELAEKMAHFIGLNADYIERSNLRVLMPRFQKELLRNVGLTIGRLDGRYTGEEADQVAEQPTLGDAASYSISSAYTAALMDYFANDLNIKIDRPYLTSNRKTYPKWNWKPVPADKGWEPHYVNVTRKMGDAMRTNKDLKVMIASGYYDLITPFFDAEYTFSRNGIVTDRVDFKYYEAGHMMYTNHRELEALCKDIRAFLLDK